MTWQAATLQAWTHGLSVQESIAVTQNYASSANLKHVLAFLKDGRTEMVSGCPFEQRGQLHDAFVSALKKQRPEVQALLAHMFASKSPYVTVCT